MPEISIHALLAESDQAANGLADAPPQISIHALLAESDASDISAKRIASISIHALLAESDVGQKRFLQKLAISIHALLAESDSIQILIPPMERLFLSTLSLRRATGILLDLTFQERDFYPRSPCGERQLVSMLNSPHSKISIHALLAESDEVSGDTWQRGSNFYPRSPCGERPDGLFFFGRRNRISIHALLAESDLLII